MKGMSATSGGTASGIEHLRQSISDILSTPIGSRVMRRDYGSRLFELIDAPITRSTLLRIYAATADAIARWEPRIRLERVMAERAEPGRVSFTLVGVYLPDGREITLDGVVVK